MSILSSSDTGVYAAPGSFCKWIRNQKALGENVNMFTDLKCDLDKEHKLSVVGDFALVGDLGADLDNKPFVLTIVVKGNVSIVDFQGDELPDWLNFSRASIEGDFGVYRCPNLKSTKGFPKSISGTLYTAECPYLSLDDMASKVSGGIRQNIDQEVRKWLEKYNRSGVSQDAYVLKYGPYCVNEAIKYRGPVTICLKNGESVLIDDNTLKGLPDYIAFGELFGGCFIWLGTGLEEMRGFPTMVGHDFICGPCPHLKTLEGMPSIVDRNLIAIGLPFSKAKIEKSTRVTCKAFVI